MEKCLQKQVFEFLISFFTLLNLRVSSSDNITYIAKSGFFLL